jgi:hypothetical protein
LVLAIWTKLITTILLLLYVYFFRSSWFFFFNNLGLPNGMIYINIAIVDSSIAIALFAIPILL